MGRVLTFSDDRVQKALRGFVPLAMERLSAPATAARLRRITSQRPVRQDPTWNIETFESAQGCYVFDADERLLARGNVHADHVLEMMRAALTESRAEPVPVARHTPAGAVRTPPKGTLVAEVFGRIAPLPKDCSPLTGASGRDVLWIPQREIDSLVAGRFPEALRRRLVLAHLRDFVRGEPGLWLPGDSKVADFRCGVARDGDLVRVRLSGRFRTSAPVRDGDDEFWPVPSGYEGTIEGELVYDSARARVTRFLLYAEGEAWGEVAFTPGAPPGRFPLKIGFRLAAPESTRGMRPYGAGPGGDEQYLRDGIPVR